MYDPPRKQRNVLLWVGIAIVGLLLLLVCSMVGIGFLFFTVIPQQVGDSPVDIITNQDGEARPTMAPRSSQGDADLPPPPEFPSPDDVPPAFETVLIEENFDEPTTRWDQSLNRIVDGSYELRVDTPNYDSYGLLLGNGRVGDFDMAVDVQQVAGDPNAEYGIRFRQSGPGDYLMFSISGSGYYRLVRVSDNVYRSIVPWTFDDRIATGPEAINRLRVVADGPDLEAYINDARVLEETDELGAIGQLTLGVTTFDVGELAVHFDNIAGQAEGLDLAEDFSNPEATDWSIGGATIEDGMYELFAGGGINMWQQPLPAGASEVENFELEVDATFVNGPEEDVAYGVMFGDTGMFSFYSLYIFPEGSVGLLFSDGADTFAVIEPVELEVINTGLGATNSLRVEVADNVIKVAVNGEELPEAEAPTIPGEVGLIVSSGQDGTIQVRYDNFRLREVPANQRQAYGQF